jgi:hypothetical protein
MQSSCVILLCCEHCTDINLVMIPSNHLIQLGSCFQDSLEFVVCAFACCVTTRAISSNAASKIVFRVIKKALQKEILHNGLQFHSRELRMINETSSFHRVLKY